MQSTISTLENDPPICKADTDCDISKIFFLYFLHLIFAFNDLFML